MENNLVIAKQLLSVARRLLAYSESFYYVGKDALVPFFQLKADTLQDMLELIAKKQHWDVSQLKADDRGVQIHVDYTDKHGNIERLHDCIEQANLPPVIEFFKRSTWDTIIETGDVATFVPSFSRVNYGIKRYELSPELKEQEKPIYDFIVNFWESLRLEYLYTEIIITKDQIIQLKEKAEEVKEPWGPLLVDGLTGMLGSDHWEKVSFNPDGTRKY